MKRPLATFFALLGMGVLAAAVSAVPALLVNWYEDSLGTDAQLVPWMWSLRDALSFLPYAGVCAFLLWLFARGVRRLEPFSKRARVVTLVFVSLISAGGAFVAFGAALITSDDFIFPTAQPSVSAKSPSGKYTAHLTFDCFFLCSLNVFNETPGSLSMRRLATNGAPKNDVTLPTIKWVDDEHFRLEGGDVAFQPLTERTFP